MGKQAKKLTKTEALKRARQMAKSSIGAGRPTVKKVTGKNKFEYVFPIKNRAGKVIAYGVGEITPSYTSGRSISKGQADLLRRRSRNRARR